MTKAHAFETNFQVVFNNSKCTTSLSLNEANVLRSNVATNLSTHELFWEKLFFAIVAWSTIPDKVIPLVHDLTVIENSKSITTLSLNEANVLCSNGATNLSTPESHYLQTTLAIHTCNKTTMKPNIL